ncbi:MAG: hypothetical protein ABSC94_30970 [Polyangiaceae bacterium]|jgi:hypothetical protein
MKKRMAPILVYSLLCACDGRELNLGSTGSAESAVADRDGSPVSGADGSAGNATATACVQPGPPGADAGPWDAGASLSPLLGVWSGYVENYAFPSGSDALLLTFTTQADGTIAGTLTFGQESAPAPPVDPTVGYWPNGAAPAGLWPGEPYGNIEPVAEGFSYTVESVQFDGSRLRFSVNPIEEYKPWCELQTSYSDPTQPCSYNCAPNAGWVPLGLADAGLLPDGAPPPYNGNSTSNTWTSLYDPDGGPTITMNAGRVTLCLAPPSGRVCSCWLGGCTGNVENTTFDMAVTTGHLDGSFLPFQGSDHNIHFTSAAGDP